MAHEPHAFLLYAIPFLEGILALEAIPSTSIIPQRKVKPND
jgi:hypothetical protein